MAAAVHNLAADAGSGEEYFLPPQKLLEGNPRQTVWLQYADDTSGQFMAGIWHSECGRWKILYTEQEYCRMLEGVSVITDQAGVSLTLRPGDECIIPPGFSGTWEVLEPTRKRFVIHEPARPAVTHP